MFLKKVNCEFTKDSSIEKAAVNAIDVKKIYYLITGRNAWHSTWVQHYYPNSFATDINEIEIEAERRREIGTVFYIIELPALCFETSNGVFVVSEINTQIPLQSFSPAVASRNLLIKDRMSKIYSISSFYPWQYLSQIIKIFEIGSPYWKEQPNATDSICSFFMENMKLCDLNVLGNQLLKRTSQPSGGKKNSLCWSIKPSEIDSSSVLRILNSGKLSSSF